MRSTSTALENAIIEKLCSVRNPKCARLDNGDFVVAEVTSLSMWHGVSGRRESSGAFARFAVLTCSALCDRPLAAYAHYVAQARETRCIGCARRTTEAFRNAVENDREQHDRQAAFKTKTDIEALNAGKHVI